MDVVSNGPDALKKYSGDKAIVEAWVEAAAILEQQQQQQQRADGADTTATAGGAPPTPPGTPRPSTPGAAADPEAIARAEAALGVAPEELMRRMMGRPELMARVTDPEVQRALSEVAAAPWKVVKYLLNKKVMGALNGMRSVIQETRSKQ